MPQAKPPNQRLKLSGRGGRLGRVRALRPGRAAVEATAVFAPAGGSIRDTMPFQVLPPDPILSRLRVTDVSAPGTSDGYQTCAVTQNRDVACLRPVGRADGTDEQSRRTVTRR